MINNVPLLHYFFFIHSTFFIKISVKIIKLNYFYFQISKYQIIKLSNIMTTIQFVRIDNKIIEKIPGGFMIGPITRFEKKYGMKLDLDKVPYISLGSRGKDNMFLLNFMDAESNRFEDLPIIVPV